jgi:hypothetical protein
MRVTSIGQDGSHDKGTILESLEGQKESHEVDRRSLPTGCLTLL